MRRRVLWAEDHPDDRELIEAILDEEADAPDVSFAPNGQVLLEMLEEERPELVVLDLKMPVMGGIEALERMRHETKWRDLPVVVFSSSKQAHEIAACNALGVEDYVQKPIAFDELCQAVRRVLALQVAA